MLSDMPSHWLEPNDAAWARALTALNHDIYSTPEFVRTHATIEDGLPRAWLLVDREGSPIGLLPIIEREIPHLNLWDATSPYGYPGISHSTAYSGADVVARYQVDAEARGLATTFLRLHPIFNRSLIDQPPHGSWSTLVRPTAVLDLADDRSIEQRLSKTSRYELRRAQREGLTVIDATDCPPAWEAFAELYDKAMAARSARDDLRFSRDYFWYLQVEPRYRLYVALFDDVVVAAATFSFVEEICQYHLAAADEARRPFSPMRSVLHRAIQDARANNVRWVHLGGGLSESDSLLEFKQSMSDGELSFRGLGLTHRHDARATPPADCCEFFPHYRCKAHA